jgi:hypothetical protein
MICHICDTRWEAVRDESDPYEIAWTGTCKCGTARSVRMGRLIEKHTEMVLHEAKKPDEHSKKSSEAE